MFNVFLAVLTYQLGTYPTVLVRHSGYVLAMFGRYLKRLWPCQGDIRVECWHRLGTIHDLQFVTGGRYFELALVMP